MTKHVMHVWSHGFLVIEANVDAKIETRRSTFSLRLPHEAS